jgi:hypothetical protein
MKRAHKINIHLHSENETRRSSNTTRTRRLRYLPQTRHSFLSLLLEERPYHCQILIEACSCHVNKGHFEATYWDKKATCNRPNCFKKNKDKNTSPVQQKNQKHKKKNIVSRSPYPNAKNFFHHCKLSGHWEENFWCLHLELHPINQIAKRRVWRVNILEYGEFYAPPIQGVKVVQGEITT